MLRLAAKVLGGAGYQVLEAHDGEEALDVASRHAVDMLVTDFQMPPGMDGGQLARRLTESDPRLKVLIVSGSWPTADERFPLLVKPYLPDELLATVRSVLDCTWDPST